MSRLLQSTQVMLASAHGSWLPGRALFIARQLSEVLRTANSPCVHALSEMSDICVPIMHLGHNAHTALRQSAVLHKMCYRWWVSRGEFVNFYIRRKLAASGPFLPSITSTATRWPSARSAIPARLSVEACTKISLPPRSDATKPNPFMALYHLIVYHVRDRLEGPLPPRGTGIRLHRSGHRPGRYHPRLPDR